ncbi:MAG TPA: hypothetical protein VKQ32_13945 [Polyangia bacterium]|nr:hypothetical protein [Polyangia bacterium]
MTPVCRQVWERAVEGGDVMADAALAAHVGSCVTCFRTLTELRDAPRVAAALRADTPPVAVSDRFWDDLAARTTGAASAALDDRKRARRRLRVTSFATVFAAAAAFVLVVNHGRVTPSGVGSGTGPAARPTAAAVGSFEDEATTEAVDVADLDESALRRLLDRLRARAPANVAALAAGGDSQDADPVPDDEGISDQLADLDGPALLRVERSLAGASL